MKKFIIMFGLIMISIMMQAGGVSKYEALEKARRFMPDKKFKQEEGGRRKVLGSGFTNSPYYVFNAENNSGFVIVSGDDRTEAILGYADHGELNIDNAPDNMKWLLDYYDKVITAIGELTQINDEKLSNRRKKTMVSVTNRTTIEPLLKTQWNQMDPYNKYCPEWVGKGVRYPTGCVATAMAQVINYHQWPKGNTGEVERYVSVTNSIDMPALPSTSFDWNNMTSDDIARLLLYCGQAVKMNYAGDGAGAYSGDASYALIHIFGYDKGIELRQRLLYSDDEWEEMIYDELYAGFPIYYAADSDKGDGHAFVVDGYDNGHFHINWGWGGNSDGYYLLTGLATDENMSPYYKRQSGIFCMRPSSEENEVISSNIYCTNNGSWDTVEIQREGSSTSFPAFRIGCELSINVNHDMSLFIGYGLYDGDELVQVLSQDQHTFISSEKYTYSKNISFSNEKDLINGDYRIVAIFRNHENEAWKKTKRADGTFIRTIISNNSLSLQSRPCNNGSIEDYEDYGIHTIQGVTYQLYYERQRFFATVLPYQLTDKKTDVLPYEDTYKYTGKVDIPYEVSFQGNNFRVDEMDSQSFWFCDDLTSLSVCGISYYGDIWQCPKLSTINLQEGVYSWGSIRYCPSLKEIELPETFSEIPRGNFLENCEKLKVIRFKGKNLSFNTIPSWDKKSLPSLTDIYFPMETPPTLYDVTYNYYNGDEIHESLGDVPSNPNAIIHIPIGTIDVYQQSQWKQWNFIEDLPGLSSEAITWGYCHGYGVANRGQGCLSGDNDMEYAMLVPKEELEIYRNCQISQILVYSPFASKYDDGDEDYEYVFITKRGTDYLVKQPCKLIRGKWNTIQLEHPYTITGEELLVGMGSHSGLTIWYSDKDFTDEILYSDTFWKREMGNDNTSTINIGTWISRGYEPAAPLRFTIEGDRVPVGAVINRLNVIEGSNINIQAEVHNKSLNTIRSYTIIWTAEDGQTRSQSYETSILPNADETIIIPLPSSLGKGTHSITIDISSVDGKANGLKGLQARTIYIVNGKEAIVIKPNDYTREYGEKNPSFCINIQGLTPNGTPNIICDATNVSPVGDYPIVTVPGSITNENVVYMNGTLTITKAPLAITAKDYTIKQGEILPTFDASYAGFKNNETESVLTQKPTFTCSATSASSPGTYDIIVSGAAAQNYDVSYVKGTLTITAPDSYVLTYIVNGEIYKTYKVEYSASITPEEEPVKEGCIFSGWSEIPATMPAKDVTVTGYFTIIPPIIAGDANDDGSVNVFDVTATVNYILGSSSDGFDSEAADANGDGTVNVFDVTKMVNIILGVDDAGAKMRKVEGLSGTDKLYFENFEIEPGEEKEVNILLDNPNAEYRDLQFDLYLPEGITVVQDEDEEFLVDTGSRCTKKHTIGFSYTDGYYVYMLYSTAKNPLTGNSGDILTITLKADEGVTPGAKTGAFRNVSLSKTDATGPTYDEFSFGITVKGEADGIEDVIANDGTYQIYAVDGKQVDALQKGVNIIRYPNGATKKVYVK